MLVVPFCHCTIFYNMKLPNVIKLRNWRYRDDSMAGIEEYSFFSNIGPFPFLPGKCINTNFPNWFITYIVHAHDTIVSLHCVLYSTDLFYSRVLLPTLLVFHNIKRMTKIRVNKHVYDWPRGLGQVLCCIVHVYVPIHLPWHNCKSWHFS